jgi:hypothetical protein
MALMLWSGTIEGRNVKGVAGRAEQNGTEVVFLGPRHAVEDEEAASAEGSRDGRKEA